MAVYRTKWWRHIRFEFSIAIPFFQAHTRMFCEAFERMVYDICRVQVKLYKWHWEFQLYKIPQMEAPTYTPSRWSGLGKLKSFKFPPLPKWAKKNKKTTAPNKPKQGRK